MPQLNLARRGARFRHGGRRSRRGT